MLFESKYLLIKIDSQYSNQNIFQFEYRVVFEHIQIEIQFEYHQF